MPVEKVAVAKLKEWEKNPRKIDKERLENLKASMQDDPDWLKHRPIVALSNGTVYAGNQRLKAARELGWEEVWVSFEDVPQDRMVQRALKDNNQWGEHDYDKLPELVGALPPDMLEFTGFTSDEVSKMLDMTKLEEIVEDEAPEPPKEPKAKPGDLYQLGNHRLLCGDATKLEDVQKLMGGGLADMVFTDPPYGVSFQSNMRTKTDKFAVLANDDTILTDWVAPVAVNSTGWVFVWTTWKVLERWLPVVAQFGKMSNMIVWHKGGGGIGDLKKTFSTDYEIALVFNRGAEVVGKRIGSVWSLGKDFAGDYQHPTQKPVALAAEAIQKTTMAGAKVLDVFGGSGTTLIACEQLKRKCYMMELDPRYVDVIIKRWENMTSDKAILLDGNHQSASAQEIR